MKIKSIFLLFLVVFLLSFNTCYSQQERYRNSDSYGSQTETENINVYKNASKAVVTIKSIGNSGSGCIIDPSGIVITNKHVISRSYQVNLSMSNGNTYTANVLDVDNDDLAILKINSNERFPYIPIGDSSKIEVGQRVLAIGNPFGLERTLTTGIISRIDYKLNRIQTDAAINPGNSGGPLLNTHGELVGINQAIVNPSGRSNSGIGFAIPSNTVKRLLALSRNAKTVQMPYKSISNNNYSNNTFKKITKSNSANSFKSSRPIIYQNKVFLGLAGLSTSDGKVVVSGIVQDSPADKAGLKFKDVVLAVDSVKVKTFDDIGFALKDKKPGDQVNVLYIRNGVVNNSTATLIPRN